MPGPLFQRDDVGGGRGGHRGGGMELRTKIGVVENVSKVGLSILVSVVVWFGGCVVVCFYA